MVGTSLPDDDVAIGQEQGRHVLRRVGQGREEGPGRTVAQVRAAVEGHEPLSLGIREHGAPRAEGEVEGARDREDARRRAAVGGEVHDPNLGSCRGRAGARVPGNQPRASRARTREASGRRPPPGRDRGGRHSAARGQGEDRGAGLVGHEDAVGRRRQGKRGHPRGRRARLEAHSRRARRARGQVEEDHAGATPVRAGKDREAPVRREEDALRGAFPFPIRLQRDPAPADRVDEKAVRVEPAPACPALDGDEAPRGIAGQRVDLQVRGPARPDPVPAGRGGREGHAHHGPEGERHRAVRPARVGPAERDLGHAAGDEAQGHEQESQRDRPLALSEDAEAPQRRDGAADDPQRRQQQGEVEGGPRGARAERGRGEVREADEEDDHEENAQGARPVEHRPDPRVAVMAAHRRQGVGGHPRDRGQQAARHREDESRQPLAAPDRPPGQGPREEEAQPAVRDVAGQHGRAHHHRGARAEQDRGRHADERHDAPFPRQRPGAREG